MGRGLLFRVLSFGLLGAIGLALLGGWSSRRSDPFTSPLACAKPDIIRSFGADAFGPSEGEVLRADEYNLLWTNSEFICANWNVIYPELTSGQLRCVEPFLEQTRQKMTINDFVRGDGDRRYRTAELRGEARQNLLHKAFEVCIPNVESTE